MSAVHAFPPQQSELPLWWDMAPTGNRVIAFYSPPPRSLEHRAPTQSVHTSVMWALGSAGDATLCPRIWHRTQQQQGVAKNHLL
jgi:hypothetical protein